MRTPTRRQPNPFHLIDSYTILFHFIPSLSPFPFVFLYIHIPKTLSSFKFLTPLHLSSHGSVELAKALAQARLGRHGLEHAAADAAGLAAGKGLGGEVVDAGGEAVVYEVAEDLFVVTKGVSLVFLRYGLWFGVRIVLGVLG